MMVAVASSGRCRTRCTKLESVHARHAHVGKHQRERLGTPRRCGQRRERLFSAAGRRRSHLPVSPICLAGCAGWSGYRRRSELSFRAASRCPSSAVASFLLCESFSFAVKWKRFLSPGSLSSQIFPPIICTRPGGNVSPSPVPPYCRVVDVSACANGSKITSVFLRGCRCRCRTRRSAGFDARSFVRSVRTCRPTSPCCVNLMALPTS